MVAIPHVLPCPRPRRAAYQDSEIIYDAEGKPLRKIKRSKQSKEQHTRSGDEASATVAKGKTFEEEVELFRQLEAESEIKKEAAKDRECPVPKPRSVFQKLMGRDGEIPTD